MNEISTSDDEALCVDVELGDVQSSSAIVRRLAAAFGFGAGAGAGEDTFDGLFAIVAESAGARSWNVVLRGFGELEKAMPDQAAELVGWLGRCNNDTAATFFASMASDYKPPLCFFQFEARRETEETGAEIAYVNCWLKGTDAAALEAKARAEILSVGWARCVCTTTELVNRSDYVEDDEAYEFVEQAIVDGEVYAFYTADDESN